MKYTTASAFRRALEQRLAAISHQTGVPLVRLRKLVVFDRLMARLSTVAPSGWVLKGAVALNFRVGSRFRTTKDLDLCRYDSEEAATADFLAAQSVDLGDYFMFIIERTGELDLATENAAVRYHITAQLAGRRFDDVTVDVGFGDPVVTEPDIVRGPDLLSFADIAPIEVPTLPLEQHIAEKVHAYTRQYAGGMLSSRVKDLIDLVMVSSLFAFSAGRLRQALRAIFVARGTHPLPTVLPQPPPLWRTAYRKTATEAGLDIDNMAAGYEQVRTFVDSVLAGTIPDAAQWDPVKHRWQVMK
jgi:hypothetical protein